MILGQLKIWARTTTYAALIAREQCELAQNSANIEREQPKMGSWAPNYPDGTLGPLGPLPPWPRGWASGRGVKTYSTSPLHLLAQSTHKLKRSPALPPNLEFRCKTSGKVAITQYSLCLRPWFQAFINNWLQWNFIRYYTSVVTQQSAEWRAILGQFCQ